MSDHGPIPSSCEDSCTWYGDHSGVAAVDLVRDGECSEACLLASGETCICICDGAWHGALVTAFIIQPGPIIGHAASCLQRQMADRLSDVPDSPLKRALLKPDEDQDGSV